MSKKFYLQKIKKDFLGPLLGQIVGSELKKIGFEKISVSTSWTFFQVQRPAANAARTFFWVLKKKKVGNVCQQRCLSSKFIAPALSPSSLHGLNTKAPLSLSIRQRTFSPQIACLRQFYVELNLVSQCIFGCNIKSLFCLLSDVATINDFWLLTLYQRLNVICIAL